MITVWSCGTSRCFGRVGNRFERACRARATSAESIPKMSQNSCVFKIAFFLGQTTPHTCRTHSWPKCRCQIKRTNTWNFWSIVFCIFIAKFQSGGPACGRCGCVLRKKWWPWFDFWILLIGYTFSTEKTDLTPKSLVQNVIVWPKKFWDYRPTQITCISLPEPLVEHTSQTFSQNL